MKRSRFVTRILYRSGAPQLLDALWGAQRLTVLSYHRINHAQSSDFPYYRPNVSATPTMFARQMNYIARHFNVIDITLLGAFLEKGRPLPPRPLLITFDDGYRDNYQYAYPLLRQMGLPATVFLITGSVDQPDAPWWDETAYLINRTSIVGAELPLIGERTLETPDQRRAACEEMLRAMKAAPDAEKRAALEVLRERLEVSLPSAEPALFLDWPQVREMAENGISFMPHTVNHTILTRIAPDEVQREIVESRQRIEMELGKRAAAFAYPNGTPADYDADTMEALRAAGYEMAFTLTPGPMRLADVRKHPLQIARVFLSYKDSFEMFVMKTMGLPALVARPTFMPEVL